MQTVKIVVWEQDGGWLGYLQEYPDYWTQGDTLDELKEHLKDIYRDLTSARFVSESEHPAFTARPSVSRGRREFGQAQLHNAQRRSKLKVKTASAMPAAGPSGLRSTPRPPVVVQRFFGSDDSE